MRQRIFIFFISTFFLLGLVTIAYAQDNTQDSSQGEAGKPQESVIAPDYFPRPDTPSPFLGQNHSYSVVLRGNGETVVTLRVALSNKTDKDLSEIALRVPRVEPKELAALQIIRQPSCIRYKPQQYDPTTRTYTQQICEEYQEPDYSSYYYGASKYQRAENTFSGDTITVKLPQAIKPDKSGSFILYFRAFGYAKKNIFGAYKFTFESLKVEDEIQNLTIGISTDSDLFLRGAKGEVQYRFEDVGVALKTTEGAAGVVANPAIDNFVGQIGQGMITKTASNLAPLESFEVKGSYAPSRLRLYAKEVLIAALVLVVIFVIIFFVTRLILSRLGKPGAVKEVEAKKEVAGKDRENVRTGLLVLVASFVSALLIAGYSVTVFLVGQAIENIIYYQYTAFAVLFLIVISFCVYLVFLLGAGVYFGFKKGVGWGVATVMLTILWLFLLLTIGVIVIFFLGGISQPPVPIPLFSK